MLLLLVAIPFLACLAILLGMQAQRTALLACAGNLLVGVFSAVGYFLNSNAFQPRLAAGKFPWAVKWEVLQFDGMNIHFAIGYLDAMSVIMVLLSVLVSVAAVFSGKCPEGRESLWYSSILLISAGAIGAFISTDVFFFYAFHELALIPTFLMIGMLGRGERKTTAWRATIYLAFGSIVLLAGLIWGVVASGGSFDMTELKSAPPHAQKGIALLLIIGFGSLVSLFPLHSWAAPAYASAPAPIAMLHAGVLKKFGLYGLIRFALPIAPLGMQHWLNLLLVLLLCNIIWVGYITVNQKRLDSMLGNSSVMHMGYIFLAIAAAVSSTEAAKIAIPAAVLLMFAHGVSIAMSFSLADVIERKTNTLELNQLGGLAKSAPALAFLFGMVGMASIGLPGLANFAGEVAIFFSGFKGWSGGSLTNVQIATCIAIWGVVISAVYMLRAFKNTFHGPTVKVTEEVKSIHVCEKIPSYLLGAALLAVGIYPNLLLQFFTK